MAPRTVALIPAAGMGRRFGATVEKQFLFLDGLPLLARTLYPFQHSPWIQAIVLVVPQGRDAAVRESILEPYGFSKVLRVVAGGPERQDSVRLGLESLGPEWDFVLVHDGARPLVSEEIIARSVEQTLLHGATLVGVPATDTIKEVDPKGWVVRTLPRSALWMVQTPQTFRFDWILRAHREAHEAGFVGTDDAALVERLGIGVRIIEGSYDNIKVTTQRDLALAREILAGRKEGSAP